MEALRQKIREDKEATQKAYEDPKSEDEECEKEEESDQERYYNDGDDIENLPPFLQQELQRQYAREQADEVGRVHKPQDSYDPEHLAVEAASYHPEVSEANDDFESELLLDLEHHLEREQEADNLRLERRMATVAEVAVEREFLQVESDVESDMDSLFGDMPSEEDENKNELEVDLEEAKNNKMRSMLLEMAKEIRLPGSSKWEAEGEKPKQKVLTGRVVKTPRGMETSENAVGKKYDVKQVEILSINEEDYIDWGEGDI